jgi:ABC-type multidrug transport system fused ATPase/permease subunit
MEQFLRLARSYFKPHRSKLVLVLIAALVASLSSFTFSYLSKVMVDDVLHVGQVEKVSTSLIKEQRPKEAKSETATTNREAPISVSDKSRSLRLLFWVSMAYICLRILLAGVQWGYTYGIARIGQEVVFRIRQDLYHKLQQLQVSYFDRYQTGKIMARVMDDVNAVESSISSVFIRVVTDVATLLIGTVILFSINAKLALIAMVTLPGYVLVYQFFVRRIRLTNRMIREANASVYGTIGDGVNGVRVMKAFARELRELRRFFSGIADYFRLQVRNSVLNTSLSVLCGLISGVGTTAVVYLGILAIRDGQMTLGEFLYFHGSIGFLFGPVVSLSNMNIMVQWVMTALHRIFEILDEDITIEDTPGALTFNELHGEVTFHNVSLKYDPDKEREALHRVNFGVLPGQMVCVVGASGAGKTSLVNLLLRLYTPTEGRITVDGEDIQNLALSSLRRHIRMVPQEPMLFSGTLAENIRYGNPQASPNEVVEASKAAELHDFVMTLPAKYETRIGEGGVSLSGGQKQRMALAMTLLTNPSVLILDDSTSALDAKTEARIYRTLDRIMETRTSFVITHKLAMARKADLVLVLDKGHLVEWGTHARLIVQRGMYYNLFETQLTDNEKNEDMQAPV